MTHQTPTPPRRVPLTYPLPQSQWLRSENGLWYSIPWTPSEKEYAMKDHYKLV